MNIDINLSIYKCMTPNMAHVVVVATRAAGRINVNICRYINIYRYMNIHRYMTHMNVNIHKIYDRIYGTSGSGGYTSCSLTKRRQREREGKREREKDKKIMCEYRYADGYGYI